MFPVPIRGALRVHLYFTAILEPGRAQGVLVGTKSIYINALRGIPGLLSTRISPIPHTVWRPTPAQRAASR